jgi:solute carrier family 25 aspartate/glutamate transporter 12/13
LYPRDGHGRAVNAPALRCYHELIGVSIIREATAKSKDGRIDQSDFLNHSAANSRYALFTPMEASMIFHFAGRGNGEKRLALLDFAQLLDPRWRAPHEEFEAVPVKSSFAQGVLRSAYNFVQGGKLFIRHYRHATLTLV